MRLYIREHVFSWGDKFSVLDEKGNDAYFVEGEVFTFGKKLHIYDAAGREVVYIEQELLHWLPHYNVYVNGVQTAQIRLEFSFFNPSYRVEGCGWQVEGEFLQHEYRVYSGNRTVAAIHKEWMTWGDCYELEIADEADALTALVLVVTIDCIVESNNN